MRGRALAAAVAAATLSACAPLPPAPSPPAAAPVPPSPQARPGPSPPAPRAAAIARHEKLARDARAAGELDEAVGHHEVLVLLDPGNATYRAGLDAARRARDEGVQAQLRAAAAARRAGDAARAREAWLRALVLDPQNAEAERGLRELEQQAMARTQAERAARARSMEDVVANARARAAAGGTPPPYADGADVEQRIELVRSADASIALREAREWADENPGDRDGRLRLAAALSDRARDLESRGQREWALPLYDQAGKLGGTAQAEASRKAAALRRALADEAYAEGMRARSSDLAAAIRHFENALRIDPQHPRARDRLREGRAAQQKLERIAK
ncbi:MAG: hypothetical protein BroJett026_34210 [Betaproteobacteria bacterium]|nr:MAG: hypothetical protein BroJett026_34210 [Betaproteobacteria bacterium]